MSLQVPESELPIELNPSQAVEAAYAEELATITSDLHRGLPVLVECDKDLAPYLYVGLRTRLKQVGLQCAYLDGRSAGNVSNNQPENLGGGFLRTLLNQLRDTVRGAVGSRVVILPHLDLLVTGQGGLTAEAREVIPLLYENPELVWLGFKDPSFPLPKVIEHLFPHHYSILGVARPRLQHLITQREARKFGRNFQPWSLYKYVSGINAVRLRKLLSSLEGEDYPAQPTQAYQQIRQQTVAGELEMPQVDLQKEIGGYSQVKKRIQQEILDILTLKENENDADHIRQMEDLIPRGIIFWGPPGTGKTLFAKAIATAIGAALTVVSGPELKSRWVGESEERLRQIFRRARQSAPALIVFDELDSFASARGTYTGSGVEHSMVNQLLTEMDGFHKEELVFVIGTTNLVESVDPALLRPGRFEFHLQIPYPVAEDRREILKIYDRSMNLQMTDEALEYTVKRTSEPVPSAAAGMLYTGDHLHALCRATARMRLRERITDATDSKLIDRALTEWIELPKMTQKEEHVVATHEAGHAVVSLFCEHAPPIERISIQGDVAGALGFVRYQDPAHRYVITRGRLRDDLCILLGGRVAEQLLLDDLSIGSSDDLRRATSIARALVEEFGMGGDLVGIGRYQQEDRPSRHPQLSPEKLAQLDRRVEEILQEAQQRATDILTENRGLLETLRDMLFEKKVLDATTLASLTANV
ncbi:ATP-dependent zinc metalloprotease FtsH [Planctomycetales bacterium 10988]|nr:ATP-dependent zinc metalloprotease FtsH [Planctomycetales bacterium 10988]